MTYANDSLFTLTPGQIVGVLILSLVMWGGLILVLRRIRAGRALRLCLAVLFFGAFVWLSPQVYYLFYWATFEGLPMQWVLKTPPSPLHLLRLLTFTEELSLSRHGQGVLGWSLLAAAVVRSPARGVKP